MVMILTKSEKRLCKKALETLTVQLMRELDIVKYTHPEDEAMEIREKMFDQMDDIEMLLDKFEVFD